MFAVFFAQENEYAKKTATEGVSTLAEWAINQRLFLVEQFSESVDVRSSHPIQSGIAGWVSLRRAKQYTQATQNPDDEPTEREPATESQT